MDGSTEQRQQQLESKRAPPSPGLSRHRAEFMFGIGRGAPGDVGRPAAAAQLLLLVVVLHSHSHYHLRRIKFMMMPRSRVRRRPRGAQVPLQQDLVPPRPEAAIGGITHVQTRDAPPPTQIPVPDPSAAEGASRAYAAVAPEHLPVVPPCPELRPWVLVLSSSSSSSCCCRRRCLCRVLPAAAAALLAYEAPDAPPLDPLLVRLVACRRHAIANAIPVPEREPRSKAPGEVVGAEIVGPLLLLLLVFPAAVLMMDKHALMMMMVVGLMVVVQPFCGDSRR